jgi:lipopolysaccharide transport system ATP-binding protein
LQRSEISLTITKTAPAVVLTHICKAFPKSTIAMRTLFTGIVDDGFQALTDVSLTIHPGETVGFLGSNGAGKSTLLQLIVGTLKPTSGSVTVNGKISALLELGAGFNPEWTGRRNCEFYSMIQGTAEDQLPSIIKKIQEFADVGDFFEKPMRTYSSGMFLRVAFAAAISVDPDIVIVDEALAVGDARFQNKCFNYFKKLKQEGKTIILVTHDPVMMSQFCTRGIVLKDGNIVIDGKPDDAVASYRRLLYGNELASPSANEQSATQSVRHPVSPENGNRSTLEKTIRNQFDWPPKRDRLRNRPYFNVYENTTGTSVGQIADILLLDENYHPRLNSVPNKSKLIIAVQFAVTRDVIKPSHGLLIKSKDDVLLFGASNIMLNRPCQPIVAGEAFIVCFEVDINLARGDYFIDIGLAEANSQELEVLEWRMSVCHFSVDNNAEMYGSVDMNANFSIL